MIRELVWYGDNILKEQSSMVDIVDDELKTLINDMFETMEDANGVGLAAVQVGVLRRVIVMSVPVEEDKPNIEMALLNPEIVFHSDDQEISEEGCLSFPNIRDSVYRFGVVHVKYNDAETFEEKIIEASGFIARVLQHEIDHTNGILFVDRLEAYQKRRLKRGLKELRLASKSRKVASA